MRISVCLSVLILLIFQWGYSQSSSPLTPVIQYTTAYVTQPSSTKQPSIRVVYESGESEVVLLEKYSSYEEREAGGKKISATDLDNQIAITAFINDLAKKGYVLKDLDYAVSNNNKYTVFIFEKIVMPKAKY